jgi:hypothetical protein
MATQIRPLRYRNPDRNVMSYTWHCRLGSIGKSEAAYSDMINERDEISGRKVRFIP